MASDRIKNPFLAIARASDPMLRYRCMYRAKVVAQSSDKTRVDVLPEDPLLPPMSNIELATGFPGLTVAIQAGAMLNVWWEDGQPDRPRAGLWDSPSAAGADNARGKSADGGGAVTKVTVAAATATLKTGTRLNLGVDDAPDFNMMGSTYRAAEAQYHAALTPPLTVMALVAAAPTLAADIDAAPVGGTVKALLSAMAQLAAAWGPAKTAFEAQSGTFLSTIVKTG